MFSLIFPEKNIWHFMQIVSTGNLHEISNPIFWENKKKKNQTVVCWKFYPEF